MQNKKSSRKLVRDIVNMSETETTEKPMMGLGDIIQKVTKATGIEKAVKFIAGEDCGCDARRDKLNKLFPIKKPLCLTEDEYNWLTEFREGKTDTLTRVESKTLSAIYTRVFQTHINAISLILLTWIRQGIR